MKTTIYLMIPAFLMLAACEDFLVKDRADAVVADEAIRDLKDAQTALNGVYSAFKSTNYYGRYFVAHADVLTDEVQSVIGYSNQLGELYKWSFLSDNGAITGAWSAMYAVAVRASNIIDKLPELEGSVDELEQIEGEARLARAIAHFDLVRSFAKAYTQSDPGTDLGVPIVTHFEIGQPKRNTIQEVYDFIVDEAETARDLMTDHGIDDLNSVYLTVAAADAFLARVSLYMGNWQDAVNYATRVIDRTGGGSPVYTLAEDSATYADMFLYDQGPEVIFRVGLTIADYNGRYIGYNYYNRAQDKPNPDYIPAQWVLDQYDSDSVDYRRLVDFKSDTTTYGWAWPLVWKYPGNPAFYGTGGPTSNANMYKMFRLSEMYLIRAEANAEQGKDNIALTDYNTLRRSRIRGYVDEDHSGEDLKDAIWRERKRELCFEGHSFFDLKRKGLGFTRVPVIHPDEGQITNPGPNQNQLKVEPGNNRWLWPIPDAELRANQNITPNPGY